jgi:putative transcriptional regulator
MIETRIAELLADNGKSLYWLAKETGVAYTTLWKLKTGESQGISFDVLDGICRALNCSPGDVLTLLPEGRAKPNQGAHTKANKKRKA